MSPVISHLSPDGRYRLDIFPKELEMSQWIDCPFLFDNQTNECVFHLGGLWNASNVNWDEKGQVVSMELLHYADTSVRFNFEVDVEKQTCILSASGYGSITRGYLYGVVEEMQRTTQLRTIFC